MNMITTIINKLKPKETISLMDKKLVEKLEEVGHFVEQDTKLVTPVRTGRLRDSISHDTDAEDLSVRIGSDVYYSKFVEVKKPFLKPTIDRDKQKIIRAFEDTF